MTTLDGLSWEELAELHPTDVQIESTRRLIEAIGDLHGATVSQQKTTNRLTAVLIWLTVVFTGMAIAQVLFLVFGVRGT